MKVLVIGSGGREHALARSLHLSDSVSEVVCAPGNPGMGQVGRCVPASLSDLDELVRCARHEQPDLVVVGPEGPLVDGLADRLRGLGIAVVGPGADGARLEASKSYAKQVLLAAGVPTAAHVTFTDLGPALAFVRERGVPIVVKADGLAAGKGVVVAGTGAEAQDAVARMLITPVGGDSPRLVIEECLVGPELSVIALVSDGELKLLAPSRDHKRAWDGDAGPNTGGMGAICPVPGVDEEMLERIEDEVFRPVLAELRRRGIGYRGFLYAGLMLCADGPKVIEFNVRLGDPEAQAILPRLQSDLGELLVAVAQGRLGDQPELEWDERAAVTVVVAAEGYPGEPRTGMPIALGEVPESALICHAGTRLSGGRLEVAGGRVLSLTCLADDLQSARAEATEAASATRFDGAWHRTDIGTSSQASVRTPLPL